MRRSLAVLLCLLALTGCSAVRAVTGSGQPGPLVVVLFDVSRSTNDPAVRARYLAAFERVLDHVVAEHGTIVGDVIDDDPLAHSTYPIDATFAACDAFTDNKLVCDAGITRTRQRVDAQARAILAQEPTASGTDIHNGLGLAERVFDSYPEAGARSLVLLSDMVERSPRLNVARAHFDDAAIGPTLDTLAAEGLIPEPAGRVGLRGWRGGARELVTARRPLPHDRALLAGVPDACGRRPAVRSLRSRARALPLTPAEEVPMATSPQPADPPLSLEPVLGWRAWRLQRIGGVLTLLSLTRPDGWPPGEAMKATCALHHESTVPSRGCMCGLYAAATPKDLARSGILGVGTCVVGAIAMWGTVVEHQRGARSRLAYPARLRLVCGQCLYMAEGAVDPTSVIDSGGAFTAVCARHRGGIAGSSWPADQVQSELLSTYGVDLMPIERIDRSMRTGPAPMRSDPAELLRMVALGVWSLVKVVVGGLFLIWAYSGLILLALALVVGAFSLVTKALGFGPADAATPSVAVASPVAVTPIVVPPSDDLPYRDTSSVHRWAHAANPWSIPVEEGGAPHEHR